MPAIQAGGLPHSDSRGSMVTCTYPRRFVACHVLRRLREPRHPPRALHSLDLAFACLYLVPRDHCFTSGSRSDGSFRVAPSRRQHYHLLIHHYNVMYLSSLFHTNYPTTKSTRVSSRKKPKARHVCHGLYFNLLLTLIFPACQRTCSRDIKGIEPSSILTPARECQTSKGRVNEPCVKRTSLVLTSFRSCRAPERRCSSRTFRYGYLVTT